MSLSETAQWLDGPGLVDWLRERGMANVKALGYAAEGAVGRWQAGARANVYVADDLLTKLSIHLSEIPDELWIDAPRTGPKLSEAQMAELMERLKAGEGIKPLAREYRLAPTTVRYHRDKALASTV